MELKIGARIKELRKARNMTQERLAELTGVTFQAVSKWENNVAFPDITLIPKLAQIFEVSTDDIFDYNSQKIRAEIDELAAESYRLRETNPEKGRKIIEAGLEKYPDNDILLNNLLYCLNYNENPDETIYIARKLIDKTNINDLKYDASRFLAYAYSAKGDSDSACAALEEIPQIYFTKLSEMAFVLAGKPKFDAAQKQKMISFETLIQMMWKLAECYVENGEIEKAICETESALKIIQILSYENFICDFKNYSYFFKKKLEEMCG